MYWNSLTLSPFKSLSVLSFFQLWDLVAGKLVFEFTEHIGPVNVEFHPNEYLLASGSSDRYVRGGRKKEIVYVCSLS